MDFFLNIKSFKDYFSNIYCVFVDVYVHVCTCMLMSLRAKKKKGHWMQYNWS